MAMRIYRLALAPLLAVGYWGSATAADLSSACQISDEERTKLGCICVVDPVAPPGHSALLDQIKGQVLKSGQSGFSPITDPTPLDIGDSVQVKASSTAELTVGLNCRNEIGPNASLVIRQTENGCTCAALLEETPKAAFLRDPGIIIGAAVVGATVGVLLLPSSP
jgi:hypothetical protein